jgi:hypothetical protein
MGAMGVVMGAVFAAPSGRERVRKGLGKGM